MPQMMPVHWVVIFLVSMILLWALMTTVLFLYQPHSAPSSKGSSSQTKLKDSVPI